MGAMRKVIAWFGVATLCVLTSNARAANDVLKPYVVLILDTSTSMDEATNSGPTSCGLSDTKINHAVCAINNIVNSYGDMVFALARFFETPGGTATACPNNCTTTGVDCGSCNESSSFAGTPCTGSADCGGGTCATDSNGQKFCGSGCTSGDKQGFQLLTGLVDGGNSSAARFTDGTCDTCNPSTAAGANPEIWGVGTKTWTPLAASLKGDKR